MQTTISLKPDIMQKAEQALTSTQFKSLEDFISFLIEEKLDEMVQQQKDPIYMVRGLLKNKNGGTALFMQDKQAEIQMENHK